MFVNKATGQGEVVAGFGEEDQSRGAIEEECATRSRIGKPMSITAVERLFTR